MNKLYLKIIFICSFSILIAEIPINYNKLELKKSFLESNSESKNKNYKYPGKAMIYSAIIPGLGQLYNGNLKRALLYSMIEATSWTIFYINNEKSKEKKSKYMNFADSEWNFENWMTHYYDWQNDANYMTLFSNNQDDEMSYEDIWDGSHHLEFTMSYNEGVILMSTTDNDESNIDYPNFRDYFINDGSWRADTSSINQLINDPNFVLLKDSHYYENVFKYNHFYSGWSDSDSLSIYDNDGYKIAKSPKKWQYREMRDQVAELQRVVSYATSVIMFNHVMSMIDAVWIAKRENSSSKIKVKPVFDYNNSFGIGGVSISVIW